MSVCLENNAFPARESIKLRILTLSQSTDLGSCGAGSIALGRGEGDDRDLLNASSSIS